MTVGIALRRFYTTAVLVFVWCALWGGPSAANILSGLVVAALIGVSGFGSGGNGGVRLGPLFRFAVLVLVDMVRSTVAVAVEVLTPTDYTDEAIVGVNVPSETRHQLLLMIVAITVTPGTAVVDADPDSGMLYLHLLHSDRRDEIEKHALRLARLACAALPPRSKDPEIIS